MPYEFMTYIDYTRKLTFEGQPDYQFLRDLFRKVSAREGIIHDFKFDWLITMMVILHMMTLRCCELTLSRYLIHVGK